MRPDIRSSSVNDPTRFHPRLADRLLGLVFLLFFGAVQWIWWSDAPKTHEMAWAHLPRPMPVLGPLYFFAHPLTYNAPLGIVLLCLLVPPLVSFVAWPRWWTALLMCLAALAWILPGIFLIMKNSH